MSLDDAPPDPPSPPPAPSPLEPVVADQVATQAAGAGHGRIHTHCENCGTALQGAWCHQCGQHDYEFHRSFGHVFLEALESLFHFEGKFFRNIVTLLFRPGRLTADFNAGRRAAQMPPFRLYIFVSFVFFLLIFLGNRDADVFTADAGSGKPGAAGGTAWSAAWAESARQMKPTDWQDPTKVAAAIERVADQTARLDPSPQSAAQREQMVAELRKVAARTKAAADQAAPAADGRKRSEFERFLEQQGRRALDPENRRRLVESFQHHVPHLLLFCLPLFALYTRVLFRKSGQVYLQHLVLALHFHTFIYLWVLCRNGWAGLAALPGWGLGTWVTFGCNLWLVTYPLLMLRHLFANSWPKTFLKTFLLAAAYSLTIGVGFAVTAILLFLFL